MDTARRIEAARAKLEELRSGERRAHLAGPPCGECIHFRYEPLGRDYIHVCGHLAYTNRVFDPPTNKTVETRETPPEVARGDDGLCGPEALLFEPRSLPAILFRRFVTTTPGKVSAALMAGGFFLYFFG